MRLGNWMTLSRPITVSRLGITRARDGIVEFAGGVLAGAGFTTASVSGGEVRTESAAAGGVETEVPDVAVSDFALPSREHAPHKIMMTATREIREIISPRSQKFCGATVGASAATPNLSPTPSRPG